MKIRTDTGEFIEAKLANCYLNTKEAACLTGLQQQNYSTYINTGKVKVISHSVDGSSMFSLVEIVNDIRRMVAEDKEEKAEKAIASKQKEIDKEQAKQKKLKDEVDTLRLHQRRAGSLKQTSTEVKSSLHDELMRGEIELNKARLRKFNLTNERIILNLKELCKQELLGVIQPIVARLDQALAPHASEVHKILSEMQVNLENAVNWNEISEDEQSLIDEAKQEIDPLEHKQKD